MGNQLKIKTLNPFYFKKGQTGAEKHLSTIF
jgi:hypothetical protein